jgi:glutaminyl-tRNA synthetase
MPTLVGIRRRGYTPESIREFVHRIGVTKKPKVAELGLLEGCIRDHLNEVAPRRFAVLDPLKLVIENYAEGDVEWLEAANHPNRPELGSRQIPFAREVLVEREDLMENPPSKFHRLKPGGEVRLRYGYIVKCERVVKDSAGNVVELRCSYDPATRSGAEESGRKVKGTIHWVSAQHAFRAPVRLYDRLFKAPFPGDDLAADLNPASLVLAEHAALEPALAQAQPEERFQFERLGYFVADGVLSKPGAPVFNRTVTLRDSWAKMEQEAAAAVERSGTPVVDA